MGLAMSEPIGLGFSLFAGPWLGSGLSWESMKLVWPCDMFKVGNMGNIYPPSLHPCSHGGDLSRSLRSISNILVRLPRAGFIYLGAIWAISTLSNSQCFKHVSSGRWCVCATRALKIWKKSFDCPGDRWVSTQFWRLPVCMKNVYWVLEWAVYT